MTATERLRNAFIKMHQEGAQRSCASTFTLATTFKVNGLDARLSIIAAISSMGGEHAPLIQTQMLLQRVLNDHHNIENIVKEYSKQKKIPGFGSGFIKGEPDPIHAEIDTLIKEFSPKTHYWMVELFHAVQNQISDKLYFNTAMYSAAFGIMMNLSPYLLPGLAIEARIPIWNHILTGILKEGKPQSS